MRRLLFLVALLYTANTFSQNRIIDSLERIASRQKDTLLIKTFNELTWQYRLVNQQKAIEYGIKAIQLSQNHKFTKGLSQAYNDLGIIYFDKQDFDSAILLYNKALDIRKKDNDVLGMARLYNKIGIVYQRSGEFDQALKHQISALNLFEQEDNVLGISYSLNNIGILNQNLGRYPAALLFHERSAVLKQKIGDRTGLAGSYVNIANIYSLTDELTKAKDYYLKAEKISREIGNKEYLSSALNNLSTLSIKTKNFEEALHYATESYELRKQLGDKKGMVSALNNIGQIHSSINESRKAEEYYNKALSLALTTTAAKPDLPSIYKNLSELYEKEKLDKALEMYKLYASTKDTLFNSNLNERFAELHAKYETLEKEKKIALLNKDNAIKALEIRNKQLLIEKSIYELTQNRLALTQANLHLAQDELEIKKQNEEILRHELDSSQKTKRIADLQTQSQIQKLEIANRELLLNRRTTLLYLLATALLLGSLLGFSWYKRYKLKQEAKTQAAVLLQQQLATKAVLEAEEAERQRIAKDLHDGVGQMMSAAKMNLSAYEHEVSFKTEGQKASFMKVLQLIDDSCKEVRSVSHNMMPNALLKNNLAAAIREFINKLDEKSLKVHLYTSGLDERLDSNTETVLYRVIQECVNNVIKHSGANTLDLSVVKEAHEITATIEDNGKGFDTTDTSKFDGLGLKNIRTRVEYLKGSVEFDSTPGKGTLVAIHIPV